MMQAKDIPDRDALETVARIGRERAARPSILLPNLPRPELAMIWDLERAWPDYPPKVVLAKMRQLLKRGLIEGCGCGCRGDFKLTDKGRAYIAGVEA